MILISGTKRVFYTFSCWVQIYLLPYGNLYGKKYYPDRFAEGWFLFTTAYGFKKLKTIAH